MFLRFLLIALFLLHHFFVFMFVVEEHSIVWEYHSTPHFVYPFLGRWAVRLFLLEESPVQLFLLGL